VCKRNNKSFEAWKEENDRTVSPSKRRSKLGQCKYCIDEGDDELKEVYGDPPRCAKHRMSQLRAERKQEEDKHTPPRLQRKRTDELVKDFNAAWSGFHKLGVKAEDLKGIWDIVSPYFSTLRTNAIDIFREDLELDTGGVATDYSDDQRPQAREERKQLLKIWWGIWNALLDAGIKRDDRLKIRARLGRYLLPIAADLGFPLNTEHE
jgi:hypothetical protein